MTAETLPNITTQSPSPACLHYEELGLLQDRVLRQLPEKERLSPVQVSVLRRVAETTSCAQAQLTSQTLSRAAVSAIVSLLINRRLLGRRFDEQDARKHVLIISDKGRQLLSKFDQITLEEIAIALRAENKQAKTTEGSPVADNPDSVASADRDPQHTDSTSRMRTRKGKALTPLALLPFAEWEEEQARLRASEVAAADVVEGHSSFAAISQPEIKNSRDE